jgi:hypothetical protein
MKLSSCACASVVSAPVIESVASVPRATPSFLQPGRDHLGHTSAVLGIAQRTDPLAVERVALLQQRHDYVQPALRNDVGCEHHPAGRLVEDPLGQRVRDDRRVVCRFAKHACASPLGS